MYPELGLPEEDRQVSCEKRRLEGEQEVDEQYISKLSIEDPSFVPRKIFRPDPRSGRGFLTKSSIGKDVKGRPPRCARDLLASNVQLRCSSSVGLRLLLGSRDRWSTGAAGSEAVRVLVAEAEPDFHQGLGGHLFVRFGEGA